MKLPAIISAIGGGAQLVTGAASAAIVVGTIYLVDCRISARGMDQVDRCYFTALPLMGVGIAGRGGFSAGYNTYNPALRKEDEEAKPTSGGIFRR
jgi:hypothetical protein